MIHRYNLLNDAGRFEEAAACFSEQGSYVTPVRPEPVVGREAILRELKARPRGTFRHFVTNVLIDAVSPVEARGRSYMLIAVAGAAGAPLPIPDGPAMTGEVEEHFVLTDDGWRFGDRVGLAGVDLAVRAEDPSAGA